MKTKKKLYAMKQWTPFPCPAITGVLYRMDGKLSLSDSPAVLHSRRLFIPRPYSSINV